VLYYPVPVGAPQPVPAGAPTSTPASTPASTPDASAAVPSANDEYLRARSILLPVAGADMSKVEDSFNEPRDGGRVHRAIDILAPRGTPVLAVERGTVEKLFTSAQGGLTIYEFDPSRTYAYYYAHLDGYAEGLHEHNRVERGAVLGYVGTTGNAPKNTPHLHFAIFKLGDDKKWWQGTAIDPFAVLR
jgi:murein DD-endopeptidase MepM/ murein hydrolase activator NlpD